MKNEAGTQEQFDQTQWSMILVALDRQSPGAQEALEQLCRSYWYPLYAFIRRRGHSPADAEDLTQGFFMDLLSRNGLQNVHPARGKFRTFLLACLENYLNNEHDKSAAAKRGGKVSFLSIDEVGAEEKYQLLPLTLEDPAKLLVRAWANTVIERVHQQLKMQCAAAGKTTVFAVLLPFITGDAARGDYAAAAARLQMTEAAARKAAHDLRSEFRRLLLREIGRTVDSQQEIETEIRDLFALFAG